MGGILHGPSKLRDWVTSVRETNQARKGGNNMIKSKSTNYDSLLNWHDGSVSGTTDDL